MSADIEVAIIGAGPYGLSLAAHLRSAGVEHQIFGTPMQSWREGMPEGMFLKSYGFASDLYEPSGLFTLERYCAENSIPYSAETVPVALGTFIDYGLAFQQQFVPNLQDRTVTSIIPTSMGFRITLGDGDQLTAHRVVVATGIRAFRHVPSALTNLPGELVTHSSRHASLAGFEDMSVAIVGAGSSALDLAALLYGRGANVELFCRQPGVIIPSATAYPRPLHSKIRRPQSPMGPGWRSRVCADGAIFYRHLPGSFRLEFLSKHLGPSGGWFIRDQVIGRIPIHLSSAVESASIERGRVQLEVAQETGMDRFEFDHVIAATGYRVDLQRLGFLVPSLLDSIACLGGYPVVSSNFESSVKGLYFAGLTTAASFGPLMRFACGAKLTSRRLAEHLMRRRVHPLSTDQPSLQNA
jgi:lysine/ornithine N-monooxygenase